MAKEKFENYTIKATIKSVAQTKDYKDRLNVNIDKEIISFKDGEKTQKNSFSMQEYNLLQQIAPFSEELSVALALSNGKPIPQQLLALCLANAEIEAKRIYHAEGEERQNKDKDGNIQIYSQQCYTTEITRVVFHLSALASAFVMKYLEQLMQAPTTTTTTTTTTAVPFI